MFFSFYLINKTVNDGNFGSREIPNFFCYESNIFREKNESVGSVPLAKRPSEEPKLYKVKYIGPIPCMEVCRILCYALTKFICLHQIHFMLCILLLSYFLLRHFASINYCYQFLYLKLKQSAVRITMHILT